MLPVPMWRRFLSVGSDYFGFLDHETHERFEAALTSTFSRLSRDRAVGEREFASMFIHNVLQTCVARATELGDSEVLPDTVLDQAIDDLIVSLDESGEEVFAARTVSHIGTQDGVPLTIGGVTIAPVIAEPSRFRQTLASVYRGIAFGAGQFVVNENLMTFDDPVAVISTTGTYDMTPTRDGYGGVSSKLHRLLMGLRLLWGATCDANVEVRGGVGPIRSHSLHFEQVSLVPAKALLGHGQLQRPVLLAAEDEGRLGALTELLKQIDVGDEDKFLTSMRSAYYRYWVSFQGEAWFDQLVDLATALEGALAGTTKTEVVLRLRSRASALLATDADPAGAIFRDIGTLYDIRSAVVHGGSLSQKDLKKKIMSISTIPANDPLGLATDRAVDRLRDLVRRALLCRLALADGKAPLWPLNRDDGVDEKLANAQTRELWRTSWRQRFASFGAGFAAEPAPAPLDRVEVFANRKKESGDV